jgi:hypothetical protein
MSRWKAERSTSLPCCSSGQFAVLPGHEVEDVERVVETHPRYLVVEKNLETVLRAEDADPRR